IGRRIETVLKDGKKIEGELLKITDDAMFINEQVSKQIENKKKKMVFDEVREVNFSDVKESKIVISFK
ncbi:MAG TPA: ribosome assembly cofactor RimP, partial [Flavobacteriaceae bacterium]|nr:ribosome assembly cofactor RimP [Flavobacteriaceae bacterium]